MFEENYENLKNNIISSTGKIIFYNNNSKLIPINTKSNEEVFKEGSFRIIGELSKILCKKQIEANVNDLNLINDEIWVDEEDSDDKYYLEKLFKDYLSMNSSHPKLLLQIPLSDDEMGKSEGHIAKFLYDVIFKDLDGIDDYFNNNTNFKSNFIISHIMKNLEETEYKARINDEYFFPDSMKNVVNIIKNDFQFAFNEQKFLLNNFEKMVSYYLFFYFSQFLLKTSTTKCSQKIEETYYLLDWESPGMGRPSKTKGYNRVRKYFDVLKIKIDVVEHLNLLLGEKTMLVPEIREYCSHMKRNEQNDFIHYLSLWVKELRKLEDLDDIHLSSDINGLIKDLENSIEEAYKVNASRRSGTTNRYRQVIKCLAETYFVKNRKGPYGYMFNIDLELLLVITRLCIGPDENISFNHLIEEYRKRGLFFDTDSQQMILREFEKLNLIDKKSDSEEVQYVRLFL